MLRNGSDTLVLFILFVMEHSRAKMLQLTLLVPEVTLFFSSSPTQQSPIVRDNCIKVNLLESSYMEVEGLLLKHNTVQINCN